MKNKELFNRTLSVLIDAYRNDTLKHGDCEACAVGNICAASGAELISSGWSSRLSGWGSVFLTSGLGQETRGYNYEGKVKEIIDATGYTWKELAKIELAFESVDKGHSDDDYMLNGLLAVYEVMCDIHVVSRDSVQRGELVFVK